MKKYKFILWHPECPGTKVNVERNWIQQIIFPKQFASIFETFK